MDKNDNVGVRIKNAYGAVGPSEELIGRTVELIQARRREKRLAIIRLALGYCGSAAACFLLAVAANSLIFIETEASSGEMIASVFGSGSGYIAAAILFVAIAAMLTLNYVKRRNKIDEKNGVIRDISKK